jgi:ribokinase
MSSSDHTQTKLDAIVLGAAAMDMLAWVDRLPEKDSIVLAKRAEMQPGGSGANVAVALARLGLKTGFVAKLSQDENGRILRQAFADAGVDISSCLIVAEMPTALCFIAIDQAGDRSMVALGGAGPVETPDELDLDYLALARLIYLTDVELPIIDAVAELAMKQSSYLVLSPGGLISARGLSYLASLLPKPDLWLLSRSEALDLLPSSSPEDVPAILCRQGAKSVAVTLGKQGVAYARDGYTLLRPAFPATKVVDTTGAGDAFAGGLLAGLLLGKPVEESLRYGSAAAACKVELAGARGGLPSMAQVEKLLAYTESS